MLLPPSWVDRIFERLLTRYGVAWVRMWEGIDMGAVKADWAEVLGGFADKPDCLAYGMANLPPDKPPTVQQLAAICNRYQGPAAPALPAPKADKSRVDTLLEGMRNAPAPASNTAWAERLRAREVALDRRLTQFQRQAWREVLRPTHQHQGETA